jgi:hypothetical protein
VLSTFGFATVAKAQTPDPTPDGYLQSQPAPIERAPSTGSTPNAYPSTYPNGHPTATTDATQHFQAPPTVKTSQPAQGVYVRMSPQGSVTTVSTAPDHTELRVDKGIVNISVHHPAQNSLILVDLAGGQVDLLKDGMYTFNADTRTARVLVGEAEAFPTTDPNGKSVKVKEDHAIVFGTPALHSVEFQLQDARTDVLPRNPADNHGDGRPYPAYGFAPYDGYYGYGYGYPYYAWDYPYFGWGYPYGFGLGFGFYGGGFYGGGFRGGGFHGRR